MTTPLPSDPIRRTRKLWRRRLLVPGIASLLFALIAIVFIPYPGMQNDEVFFANPIYSPESTFYRAEVFGTKIPCMVMSYSGALKTWIFAFLWGYVLDPSKWSLRTPAMLFGVATLLLTWSYTRRLAGTAAAVITTFLLATDISFQLTNTFDWGPVALQHLCLMAGLTGIYRSVRTGQKWPLLLGAFCWGLGIWDKALLVWPLIALTGAALTMYPRQTLVRLRSPWMFAAVLAFLAGAAPLVWYNVDKPAATATTNANFSMDEAPRKVRLLLTTTDGSALFDYMVRGNYAPNPRQPKTALEKASVGIAKAIGEHRHDWMVYGFVLALVPGLWRRTRLTVFLLVVIGVIWVQMLITRNTGGAAHHVILIWPFPAILMGVGFAALPRRAWVVVLGVLMLENLLTANEYLAEFTQFGTTVNWTDAIFRLSDAVDSKMATDIEIVDWGYLNGLRLLHEGDLPLRVASDPLLKLQMTTADREEVRAMIDSPQRLFIRHTEGNEMFPGLNDRLRRTASDYGYREKLERTVHDRNGRPIFELFRFQKP